MVCVVALGPLPASQGHSWDNGHSGHRKEICPVAEERGLSAPHPRLLSADISLTRKSPSKGAQSGEARWPAAAAHVARNTARPSPKHRAGVGPRPLTEPSARRGPPGSPPSELPSFPSSAVLRAWGWEGVDSLVFFPFLLCSIHRSPGESPGTGPRPAEAAQSGSGAAWSSAVALRRRRPCASRRSLCLLVPEVT